MTDWLDRHVLLFVFNFVFFCATFSSQCQVCQLNDHRLPDFDGKSVSDLPLSTQGGLEKLWMCTRMCSEDNRCRSYRYNSLTGACSAYGVGYSTLENIFNTVTIETGSQLYLMCGKTKVLGSSCSSTADCNFSQSSCNHGSCGCSLGHSFDVNTGDCVTQCADYTDLFEMYTNHGVDGCNKKVENRPTGDACMESCRDETTFFCVNAEYKTSSGACNMCDKDWLDLSPAERNTADYGWVLYHRKCDL